MACTRLPGTVPVGFSIATEGHLDTGQHSSLTQADYALSRLVTLKDRTEVTESLAKMHLAQRRNELVSFDLMLTVISVNISLLGGVACLCGMNFWLGGSGAPKARHAAAHLPCWKVCMQDFRGFQGMQLQPCCGVQQLNLLTAGVFHHLCNPSTGVVNGGHGCNFCIRQTSPIAADSVRTVIAVIIWLCKDNETISQETPVKVVQSHTN